MLGVQEEAEAIAVAERQEKEREADAVRRAERQDVSSKRRMLRELVSWVKTAAQGPKDVNYNKCVHRGGEIQSLPVPVPCRIHITNLLTKLYVVLGAHVQANRARACPTRNSPAAWHDQGDHGRDSLRRGRLAHPLLAQQLQHFGSAPFLMYN